MIFGCMWPVTVGRMWSCEIPRSCRLLPSQSLLEAAQLAAYFSQARNAPKVEIHYTQKRFVSLNPEAPSQVWFASKNTTRSWRDRSCQVRWKARKRIVESGCETVGMRGDGELTKLTKRLFSVSLAGSFLSQVAGDTNWISCCQNDFRPPRTCFR